jgi:hypothetical protein
MVRLSSLIFFSDLCALPLVTGARRKGSNDMATAIINIELADNPQGIVSVAFEAEAYGDLVIHLPIADIRRADYLLPEFEEDRFIVAHAPSGMLHASFASKRKALKYITKFYELAAIYGAEVELTEYKKLKRWRWVPNLAYNQAHKEAWANV